jgi:fatty acid CoA ligase FadD36
MSLLASLGGDDLDHAVEVAGQSVSRVALVERASLLASAMVGMPAVAVDATPTLATVEAVVAGLLAGVPVVPVPPDAGPVEREHILRDSGALPLPHRAAVCGHLPNVADDTAALVMYTSGTTGAPKGAVLSRRAVAAGLDGLAAAWEWTPDDVLVHGLPLFHVHGLVLGVLGPLRVGCRLVHTGRPTPEAYAAAGGSLYFGVPTVWGRVCADATSAAALSGARLLVSGSAPLPVPVFEQLRSLTGAPPVERYGMTETLITVSTTFGGERRPGWVGLPIEGVQTRLDGDDGELQVRGSTLFDGYLGRPDTTAASFTPDGWFRTGDAAEIDAGGFHRIIGRLSMDIIKTGGFKVGAGEVEASLLGHPGVQEAAVVGAPDDDLGQRIVAFVVGEGLDAAALVQHVAGTLSVHKRPREVRVVDSLPRNAMGKVQKNLLR